MAKFSRGWFWYWHVSKPTEYTAAGWVPADGHEAYTAIHVHIYL